MRNKQKRAVSAVKQRREIAQMAQDYKNTKLDPTMLQINLLLQNSKLSLPEVAARCGVTIQTMYSWRKLATKRPQGITMKFVLRALGYDLRVMPSRGHNLPPDDAA